MPLKKQSFLPNEIAIYDEAVIYQRGEYWQMRMWLAKEKKYARFSLKTRNRDTAIDKAKKHYHELMAQQLSGKTYFSKTTKQGVQEYLQQRQMDVQAGLIVSGRYSTVKTHLEHWLEFIGRDVKLKELERTDCENYLHSRTKTKKKITISQTTVANEQSTINAMIAWLFKRNDTYIEAFDFKPLKRIDRGMEENRRATFTDREVECIDKVLAEYIQEAEKNINISGNLIKAIAGYYIGFSLISGLRRGEQLQLRWQDTNDTEHSVSHRNKFDLIKITVRGATSKVRKTRKFVVKDFGYWEGLFKLRKKLSEINLDRNAFKESIADDLIFSANGKSAITPRAIGYHFDAVMERANIQDIETRDLVPYSCRHYFITKRVNSGLSITAIAEMCGTSVTQIEKTYYHTSFDKMVSNALADYQYVDGILVPR